MARKRATDHRALVLESVATNPKGASERLIVADCADPAFPVEAVKSMIWQLRKEGLIARDEAGTGHHITKAGLDYLAQAAFDRGLPPLGAPRLKARKRKPA